MATASTITEADILEKVIAHAMTPEAARAILNFKFDGVTTKQIRQLLQKNAKGVITVEERLALEKFLRVGKFIDILHAKARRSLRQTKSDQ